MIKRLYLGNWLYNAGLLGFYRMLSGANKEVIYRDNYIEFDTEILKDFQYDYFNYFIEEHKEYCSYVKVMEKIEYMITGYEDVESLKESAYNQYGQDIEFIKSKITSRSYLSAYNLGNSEVDIVSLGKKLKKISYKNKIEKTKSILEENKSVLEELKDALRLESVRYAILSKNVIYDVIALFWEGYCFLNPKKVDLNIYDYFKECFLDNIEKFKEDPKAKYICSCCETPIKSKSQAKNTAWLKEVGVNTDKKASHFWNYGVTDYNCPWCILVFACIPGGFSVRRRNGIFVNNNTSMSSLIRSNQSDRELTNLSELEEDMYYKLAQSIASDNEYENAFNELDDIQVVRLIDKESKTGYSFNLLSKEKLRTIVKFNKALKYFVKRSVKLDNGQYVNIYNEVINRLYENKNMFDLVYKVLRIYIDSGRDESYMIKNLLKINLAMYEKKEERLMASYTNINDFTSYGQGLRALTNARNSAKISGISYRLLNALKTNNVNTFMDTLINAYMYVGQPLPRKINSLLVNEMNFKTYGYAFVTGLQAEDIKNGVNKESEDN